MGRRSVHQTLERDAPPGVPPLLRWTPSVTRARDRPTSASGRARRGRGSRRAHQQGRSLADQLTRAGVHRRCSARPGYPVATECDRPPSSSLRRCRGHTLGDAVNGRRCTRATPRGELPLGYGGRGGRRRLARFDITWCRAPRRPRGGAAPAGRAPRRCDGCSLGPNTCCVIPGARSRSWAAPRPGLPCAGAADDG